MNVINFLLLIFSLNIVLIQSSCGSKLSLHKKELRDENNQKKKNLSLTNLSTENFIFTHEMSPVKLEGLLIPHFKFLEHVFDSKSQEGTSKLIVNRDSDIYESSDTGENFLLVHENNDKKWTKSFTLENNSHLLWEENEKRLYLFDSNWNLLKTHLNGNFSWHGSFSIDEAYGAVMYAEYIGDPVDYLHVWRSTDSGNTWKKVLTKKGQYFKPENDIRHFHTIRSDPFVKNTWYLSSGDTGAKRHESRVWISSDNGDNWRDITDETTKKREKFYNVHRYTAIQFDKDYLYWGTDDLLDGKPKLIRSRRTEPLELEVLDDLGNVIRSLVKTPLGHIMISEQKVPGLDLKIYLIDKEFKTTELFTYPEKNPKHRTGFTYSISSVGSDSNGVFFSLYTGHKSLFFKNTKGVLRWKISQSLNPKNLF